MQQVAQVTCVNFADVYPYNLAATSSARVTVYNSNTRRVNKTFARFKDVAYSGVLRSDGRAMVVGGQQGMVQLFDMASRSILRVGPAIYSSPRHRMPFNARNEGSKCVG